MTKGLQGTVILRPGRPSLLTSELSDAICASREDGLTLRAAAAEHGVLLRTCERWRHEGEKLMAQEDLDVSKLWPEQELYLRFARNLGYAEAAFERRMVEAWLLDGTGDWRSHATFLERYAPEDWGPRTSLAVRVERLQQQLVEVHQERWQAQQQDGAGAWMTPELIVAMLRQLRELGMMTRKQAELTKELEQDAAARGWRLTASLLPDGVEPGYLDDEPGGRPLAPAAIEAALSEPARTAADQKPPEPEYAPGEHPDCLAGQHVAQEGALSTCRRCGVYKHGVKFPVG